MTVKQKNKPLSKSPKITKKFDCSAFGGKFKCEEMPILRVFLAISAHSSDGGTEWLSVEELTKPEIEPRNGEILFCYLMMK